MKKFTLSVIAAVATVSFGYSQPVLSIAAPPDGGTSTQLRAPNGNSSQTVMRGCFIVTPAELTALATGPVISSFGFALLAGTSSVPVTGSFTVYLQNTTSTTYAKGTNWTTALTGMTTVFNGQMTVPATNSPTTIILPLAPTFNYTGGGLYVAYDWNSTGPFDAGAATYVANANLNPGGATIDSPTAPAGTILTATQFRPTFIFGATNTAATDMQVLSVFAPGKVSKLLNSPHTVSAMVKNGSIGTLSNISVSLSVTGANPFSDVATIPSLTPGDSTLVSFTPFNPQVLGANTLSVMVASDQNNLNNSYTYAQSVTCNTVGIAPSVGSYSGGVGFGTGSGIISAKFTPPVTTTITAVRIAIANDASTATRSVWGVLMDSFGSILATTNTLGVSAAMLNTYQHMTFTTAQPLTAGSDYFIGLAQPASQAGFHPLGSQPATLLPGGIYFTSALTGGALNPLPTNLGYFGIEPVLTFTNIMLSAASTKTNICNGESVTITASGGATTFTWNTNPVSTSASIVVSPTATTVYIVNGTDGVSGCRTNSVAVSQSVSACVGLPSNSIVNNEIRLYPNPALNGKSTISGLNGANTIQVYNILGQMVITQRTSEESTMIDLSSQPNGTYLVKIFDDSNTSKTVKIVNQN